MITLITFYKIIFVVAILATIAFLIQNYCDKVHSREEKGDEK